MNLKSGVTKIAGKSSYWFLHNVSEGRTSFPGKFAMKIDPEVLNSLAKGYETIIVTGTNDKTMTAALIVEALRKKYGDILTNPSGSNMQQGIVTAFLAHKNKKAKEKITILKVDEANIEVVAKLLHPSVFVLTDIFRDQMDRYGEVYTTYREIVDGIKLAPDATIIANGDTSIFSSVELPNRKVFCDFKLPNDKTENDFKAPVNTDSVLCPKRDHILHYHERTYADLEDFLCSSCGYHRPELTYGADQIVDRTPNSLESEVGEREYSIDIGDTYNIYNALATYSVAREFGLSEEEVAQSFAENKRTLGRQELISYAGKEIDLILVESPVGLDEVLHIFSTEKDSCPLVALLSANHADGTDTSWIWDTDYEDLSKDKIRKVLVGGRRWHNMGFRLEVPGFDQGLMTTVTNSDALLDEISKLPTKRVYILATYTAMLSLCKTMGEKKIIKAGM